MTSIFDLNKEEEEDLQDKINLDELYEKKREHDLSKLAIYKKILSRIHVRIKATSRQKIDNQFCWYVVPEIIIGVPKYDQGACVAYILDKLEENGLIVRYTHPNLLFISWKHWVPGYVRTEIKKQTGKNIDGYGNILQEKQDAELSKPGVKNRPFKPDNPNDYMFNGNKKVSIQPDKKQFKSTNSYKPTGMIYTNDHLKPFTS
jgi:hypothetical protein